MSSRSFFIENALYSITAPAILVVPPFAMHKTEGGAFRRVNIYVTESMLNDFQKEVLTSLSLSFVPLTDAQSAARLRSAADDRFRPGRPVQYTGQRILVRGPGRAGLVRRHGQRFF